MKNSNDYIKKLDLTTLFKAGNFWRDGIEPKLILESEANFIDFPQILLSVAKLWKYILWIISSLTYLG